MLEVRERLRSIAVVAAAAVALLPGCSVGAADEPTRGANQNGYVGAERSITQVAPADRKPAPTLSGRKLGSDATISTQAYAGKVVVLNVWGSWCGPCRGEAKDLQAASVQTAESARFVGLNTRDADPAPAMAFVRAFAITYPSIYDPDGKVLVQLSGNLPLSAIPSTLIIDTRGRVAARIVGPITTITLVDLIDDVAAGR